MEISVKVDFFECCKNAESDIISVPSLSLHDVSLQLALPPDRLVQPLGEQRVLLDHLTDLRSRVLGEKH